MNNLTNLQELQTMWQQLLGETPPVGQFVVWPSCIQCRRSPTRSLKTGQKHFSSSILRERRSQNPVRIEVHAVLDSAKGSWSAERVVTRQVISGCTLETRHCDVRP
jgi:hypothetical protein